MAIFREGDEKYGGATYDFVVEMLKFPNGGAIVPPGVLRLLLLLLRMMAVMLRERRGGRRLRLQNALERRILADEVHGRSSTAAAAASPVYDYGSVAARRRSLVALRSVDRGRRLPAAGRTRARRGHRSPPGSAGQKVLSGDSI